ncbi:MAG TPA: winged helix-turn-helix domain-containing protein [Candidatus Methanofastidiosa archaeon]|nr:winged helix-turn-helix domain-containing protein [Candidatus Methanofastidiosa archaeon]HPR40935.1 winged helix-turn-helix domain-containing protein [Candidatus Methanofastidiosa archaeon]
MAEDEELFHVVSMNDEKAKIIAMELANDKGRMVLDAIFEGKKSSSEISKELNINLPTVLFHIERLIDAGVIKVIDTNLSKKFREIKYYGPSKRAILIIPEKERSSLDDVSGGLISGINAKLLGITGMLGAALSGGFIRLFSKSSDMADKAVLEVQNDCLAPTTEGVRDAASTFLTLPSNMEIVGIVIAAAVIAVSVVMVAQRVLKKRKN